MSIQIAADSFCTDETLPILYKSPIINKGTLLYIDANKVGFSGVPVNGTKIINLASDAALPLVGGLENDLHPLFIVTANFTPDKGIIQRTPKGGIHGIISKIADIASMWAGIPIPPNIVSYIKANPGHKMMTATWFKVTRASNTTGGAISTMYLLTNVSNYYFAIQGLNTIPATEAFRLPATSSFYSTTGNRFADVAFTGPVGTIGTTANRDWLWMVGNGSPFGTGTLNKGWSVVFYGAYIEDLAVSGKTYAEAHDAALAFYNAQVETIGGKYYEDTPNDPATVLP